MPLKAIRIQEKFTEHYTKGNLTADKLAKAGITWRDVFQEIPIHVTNSVLASQVMRSLQPAHRFRQVELERLSQRVEPFLAKHVDKLRETMEQLISETQQQALYQRKHQRYVMAVQQRQEENQARIDAGEEALPEDKKVEEPVQPTQLNAYLVANQVDNYCSQLDTYTGQTLQKIFLMDEL